MSEAREHAAPLELHLLLGAPEETVREAAWEKLMAAHTRLILAAARSFGGGHDEALNRYAYILEKCRESDFRRLRTFEGSGGASFSTWLTVIARRLCLDYERARYGRYPTVAKSGDNSNRAVRRSLVDSIAVDLDIDRIESPEADSQETAMVRAECTRTLRALWSGLTPREQLLLALRFEDDLPAARIASMLGLPTPFHVYRQLNGVLAKLRAALVSRGIDGPGD